MLMKLQSGSSATSLRGTRPCREKMTNIVVESNWMDQVEDRLGTEGPKRRVVAGDPEKIP